MHNATNAANVSGLSSRRGSGFYVAPRPAPLAAQAGGAELSVNNGSDSVVFREVLVGEVWLCAGQSNMDFTLAPTPKRSFARVRDWKRAVAAGNHPA